MIISELALLIYKWPPTVKRKNGISSCKNIKDTVLYIHKVEE